LDKTNDERAIEMAQELGVTRNPYQAWWVLHRAVIELATCEQKIRYRVALALSVIQHLDSDDFPHDLRARFSAFEANLQAQILAAPMTDSGPLEEFARLPEKDHRFELMIMKLTVPTCHDLAREIAGLYEILSRTLIQGPDDLNT